MSSLFSPHWNDTSMHLISLQSLNLSYNTSGVWGYFQIIGETYQNPSSQHSQGNPQHTDRWEQWEVKVNCSTLGSDVPSASKGPDSTNDFPYPPAPAAAVICGRRPHWKGDGTASRGTWPPSPLRCGAAVSRWKKLLAEMRQALRKASKTQSSRKRLWNREIKKDKRRVLSCRVSCFL